MNKYKKFIIFLFMFIIFLSLLYVSLVSIFINFTSFEFVSEKNSLITQTVNQNKIIIDSGSNSYHGINSKMIEDYFKKLTINISENASMSLNVKLHRINKFAKSGDIVILPLEYIYYVKENEFDVFYDNLFFEGNHYFNYLPLQEKIKIIFKIPFYSLINSIYKSYRHEFFTKKYINHYFNGKRKEESSVLEKIEKGYRGDFNFVNKVVFSPEKLNDPCQEYIFAKIGNKKPKISENFKENLKFIKKIEKTRDIKFIFTYPAVGGNGCYNESSYYGKNFIQFIKDIKSYILENGVEFIGDYNESYFSQDLLHDTWFHIVPEARDIRTMRLIDNLSKLKH